MSAKSRFIAEILPICEELQPRFAKALVAQAALETGWGRFVLKDENGKSSYNLFNIKAGRTWTGDTVSKLAREYRDKDNVGFERSAFRAYSSYRESIEDYIKLIKTTRYNKALEAKTDEDYIRLIYSSGYATDPNYVAKVTEVLRGLG